MDFINNIPVMDRTALRELKKGIDLSFKEFSRAYGEGIESFFDPLLTFLIFLEKLLVSTPWPIVIGIFGLLGSGLEELGRKIYGVSSKIEKGKILLYGKDYNPKNPQQGKINGIGFIPAERKTEGILSELPLRANMTIPFLDNFISKIFISKKREKEFTNSWIKDFDIKCLNSEQLFRFLSGGNQQKLVIGREMSRNINLLIASQPTRGVDVGSIEYIHNQIIAARDSGIGVLLNSTELEEIIALSDRIIVFFKGRIVAELPSDTDPKIIGLAMGGVLN